MKQNKLAALALCFPVLLIAGCADSSPKRIDAGGMNAVTTMGADVRDFKTVAGELTQSLLVSPALARNLGHLPVIEVSKIINDTAERFDTDQITFKITTDILNSGKAQWVSTDKAAQSIAARKNFENDVKQAAQPDYVLYAKILQTSARQGNLRENTFTLQFSLADSATGNTVWQSEKDFAKQGKRPGVGF